MARAPTFQFKFRISPHSRWSQTKRSITVAEAAQRYGEGNYEAMEYTKEEQHAARMLQAADGQTVPALLEELRRKRAGWLIKSELCKTKAERETALARIGDAEDRIVKLELSQQPGPGARR